jgi:hypothetical protein
VFLGSPAEGLAAQSHQELTVGCGEGFLGKAKNNRSEPLLPQLLCLFLNWVWGSCERQEMAPSVVRGGAQHCKPE